MSKFVTPSLRRRLLKFVMYVELHQNRWIVSWNRWDRCRRINLQIRADYTSSVD